MQRWWPSPLERHIALRYLRGQRGTRSASLQTMIAIGGFTVGVMALILVLGVMNGLSLDLREKILVALPHLRVLAVGPGLRTDDWRKQLAPILSDPDVLFAAPEVATQTIASNWAKVIKGPFVMGLEPGVGTDSVASLNRHMVSGTLSFTTTLADAEVAIVIGTKLAAELGVGLGDTLKIMPSKYLDGSGNPRPWLAEVTGVFETGMYIYDNQTIVMNLKEAQDFTGLDNAVTDIAVRVRDSWKVEEVARRIEALLGPAYRVETWQTANGALFGALKLEKLAIGLVIFIIMIVAAMNIVGTLTMVVAFKTREIGILMAMGMRRDGIRRIFMVQGAIVGIIGTAFGLALGLVTGWVVDGSGLIRIDASVYFIDRLPVRIQVLDVLTIVSASVLASFLATVHPSRAAAKLAPVDAIRAE